MVYIVYISHLDLFGFLFLFLYRSLLADVILNGYWCFFIMKPEKKNSPLCLEHMTLLNHCFPLPLFHFPLLFDNALCVKFLNQNDLVPPWKFTNMIIALDEMKDLHFFFWTTMSKRPQKLATETISQSLPICLQLNVSQ